MPMTPSSAVAQQIISTLGVQGQGSDKALADMTAIVDAIRTMVLAATVTIDVATANVAGTMGAATGPVTGTAKIT